MAEKVVFKLKDPQKKVTPSNQKETLIFLIYNFGYFEQTEKRKKGKKYIPLKYSTGKSIKPCYWDKTNYRAKQTQKFNHTDFNRNLESVKNDAKMVYEEMEKEKLIITPSLFRHRLKAKLTGNIEPGNINLNQFIETFIKDIETGKRLTIEGKRYKPSTIKDFKGFRGQFSVFQDTKEKIYDFENITMDFYDEFLQFFNSKNYSPNTIGKHIKMLKTIMRAAREQGLHKNYEIDRKKFKTTRVEVKNIYLNLQELQQLAELDLSKYPNLELARDVFLIGCYTAQRFSDYSRIKKENIRTLENGRKVIDLTQRKTGERVIIPIKPELELILKKYDYSTPKIFEQKLNKLIKEVGKMAEINEPIIIKSTQGGLDFEKQYKKYELIQSHTARRAGCTNMYLAGIKPIDLMKISGHKSEKILISYICVTKEETAQNLSTHPYFNTNLRAIK